MDLRHCEFPQGKICLTVHTQTTFGRADERETFLSYVDFSIPFSPFFSQETFSERHICNLIQHHRLSCYKWSSIAFPFSDLIL